MSDKLQTLIEIEGFESIEEFGERYSFDSVIPGICMNDDCDYTTNVEPDCTNGWCEECRTCSVRSGIDLILF